jgi:preprotein translocase subunit SecF
MTTPAAAETPERAHNPFVRLYRGETSFDFVGRRKLWYLLSAIIIVAGLVSLTTRGFNFGIDFKGGTSWQVQASGLSVTTVTTAVEAAGVPQPTVESLGSGNGTTIEVQADLSKLSTTERQNLEQKVAGVLGRLAHTQTNNVAISDVGPTWGSQITKKAVIAVIVFFIVVVVYISFRFEWKMAVAAFIAVIHDLLVTAGIYSLFGFQVTPDTVIAVLTILGYSLYDTVVVFDRIRDSTRGLGASGRMTYGDVVNLSMNQVLARSINTSLVAILPVLSVLVIGAELLGATTLQYFGLALVIGLLSGAYSSIFIASPLLAQLKERERRYADLKVKLANRDTGAGLLTPAAAARMMAGGESRRAGRAPVKKQTGTIRPAARTAAARAAQAGPRSAAARTGNRAVEIAPTAMAGDEVASNGDGIGTPAPAARPSGGGAPRAGGTAARRPPPRKGKGGKSRGKGGRKR